MNEIRQISIDYLSPSRTLEAYQLSFGIRSEIIFIYNYEGMHFRFFKNGAELVDFFKEGKEPQLDFEDEEKLDSYLETKKI